MQYADCFHRLSQIRVWNDGNANNQVRIGDVYLTGGCSNDPTHDAYFDTLPVAATDCRIGARVYVNWGDRSPGNLDDPDNFSVTVNGRPAVLSGSLNGPQGGEWVVPSSPGITANPGANTVTVAVNWDDNDNHAQRPVLGGRVRRQQMRVQRVRARPSGVRRHPGHGRRGRLRAHLGLSVEPLAASAGDAYETEDTGGNAVTLYPTIGIRSVLRTGVYTTLRLDDPQANQTLRCDPNFAQGQEFSAFRYGCEPWYGENHFNGDVQPAGQHGVVVEHGHEDVPRPRPVVLVRRPGRGLRRQLEQQPVALRPDRTGSVDRPDRRRHRRGDRQLRQHQQQLVPELRLQLRRELRREAGMRPAGATAARRPARRTRRSAARRTRASSTCSSSRTRRARA